MTSYIKGKIPCKHTWRQKRRWGRGSEGNEKEKQKGEEKEQKGEEEQIVKHFLVNRIEYGMSGMTHQAGKRVGVA